MDARVPSATALLAWGGLAQELLLWRLPSGDVSWLAPELPERRFTPAAKEASERFLLDGMGFKEAHLAASRSGVRS